MGEREKRGGGRTKEGDGLNLLDDRKDIARKRIICVYQDPAIYS